MKVAVSIPDELFAEADRVAHQKGLNRSTFYARALQRLVAEEENDELTRRINATCTDTVHDDVSAVARADLIETGAWEW
jgi:metal-responsive CopG/Arc/MetJ family transcriptional regulator